MGLGSVKEGSGMTFLSVAGGFIWNRKADSSDQNYATQEYTKADKTTDFRKGAQYADLLGKVVGVEFKTHAEYGESVNVTFDADEELYVISISTNNRYSQDLMKALLVMDLEKDLFMKPYDFVGKDKKRAQGISFKQDGVKLDLKIEGVPTKDAEWFKTADKKKIKRFFEDLSDWFVAEIEETIVPKMKPLEKRESKEKQKATKVQESQEEMEQEHYQEEEDTSEESTPASKKAETKVEKKEEVEEKPKATPLVMKKSLRAYISENYEGQELPDLSKEDLVKWYDLCLAEEELPFEEGESTSQDATTSPTGEMSAEELEEELKKLI